jgi:uncharacterized protein
MKENSSPCIGFCSTTYGDDICRGCYRSFAEVVNWRQRSLEERKAFYQNVDSYVERLLKDNILITDSNLLTNLCVSLGIEVIEGLSCYYLVLQLLQRSAYHHLDEKNGLKKNTLLSWSELYRWLDQEIFILRLNQLV